MRAISTFPIESVSGPVPMPNTSWPASIRRQAASIARSGLGCWSTWSVAACRYWTCQVIVSDVRSRRKLGKLVHLLNNETLQGIDRMSDHQPAVARHYGRGGLLDRILGALADAGKDIEHLSIDDLAPVDEFHGRQRRATEELAALLAPQPGQVLLDIGSGIGGPSRYLAKVCGCRVSGLDLTPEFVAAASDLTRRTGLTGQVDFREGSALELPFPDASFDLAWSQNVAMNIADRARWYAEVHRVLRPGGRFAFQDVAQGPAGEVHFPVPWSDTSALSFLRTPEDTR